MNDVSVNEIKKDIGLLYERICVCEKSKVDLTSAIDKEMNTIVELNFYIAASQRRMKKQEKTQYDIESLRHNINRCHQNIQVFNETIDREDSSIENFKHMIRVLTNDLKRPKEILFDAATGQVIQ